MNMNDTLIFHQFSITNLALLHVYETGMLGYTPRHSSRTSTINNNNKHSTDLTPVLNLLTSCYDMMTQRIYEFSASLVVYA